jgi:hypothetical protein
MTVLPVQEPLDSPPMRASSPRALCALTAALPLLLLAFGGVATASPKKGKKKGKGPVWPVPNPTFLQPAFQPSANNRQISGVFGPRLKWSGARYDHHEGFDFFSQYDLSTYPRADHPILSVMPGVVSAVIRPPSPERTSYGRKVVVTHDVPWSKFGGQRDWGNVRTAYLHLSSISVKQGDVVKAGQELGRAGESGYTSTVHLHFNCYRAGGADLKVNPARLFSPKRFPGTVAQLHKSTIEVDWLERNVTAGTATVRVILPHNAYTLDGFAFVADKDSSRVVSFEHVSATAHQDRDTGDVDLFEGFRLFPLRYNGGGAIDRVNARGVQGWPMATYPVAGGKGVRLGYDFMATGLPPKVKKFKLVVLGVLGKKITFKAPGFRNLIK